MIRLLVPVASFLASLAAVGVMSHFTQWLVPLFGAWLVHWLFSTRTRPRNRVGHVQLLALGMFVMIVAGALILWIERRYSAFVSWVDSVIGFAMAILGYQLPLTAVEAYPLLNILALFVWLLIKIPVTALVDRGGLDGLEEAYEIAYRRREGRWLLKPWWIWSRPLALSLATIGAAFLAWQWWQLDEPGFGGWVMALPAALIAIGIEWWLWLSGEVDDRVGPEFSGDGGGTEKSIAMFEDLWGRYRRVWPGQWRAAGNRGPETPDG